MTQIKILLNRISQWRRIKIQQQRTHVNEKGKRKFPTCRSHSRSCMRRKNLRAHLLRVFYEFQLWIACVSTSRRRARRRNETKKNEKKPFILNFHKRVSTMNVELSCVLIERNKHFQSLDSLSCMFCEWNLLSSHRCRRSLKRVNTQEKGKSKENNRQRWFRQLQGRNFTSCFPPRHQPQQTILKRRSASSREEQDKFFR